MSALREVVASVLSAEGALVEPIEPEGLEILAPEPLQKALLLPEWSRLGFGSELPDGAQRISLESDWVERLDRLLGRRGRALRLGVEKEWSFLPRRLQRLAEQEMALENATYRVVQQKQAKTYYLLLVFRITATSDEKRDDLILLCINESNGALADHLIDPLLAYLRQRKEKEAIALEDEEWPPPWPARGVHERVELALPSRIATRLAPFLEGMKRRMTRDLERLHAYHNALRTELITAFSEKASNPDALEVQEMHGMRLEAIEREYYAKVNDLRRKYAMSVDVHFTQALRVALPVCRLGLLILRRKGKRDYFLDWNPLSRKLDSPPCEACWTTPRTHRACDDQLHLICSTCLSPCPSCGKQVCRACHPSACPKCRQAWPSGTGGSTQRARITPGPSPF